MKILVVEDDSIVAQTLKFLLANYNYAVDIAADGEIGLQMADAFSYDLMVLDVVLPKRDGISLCQQLRTKGFQNPILLLTGRGEGWQKATALNAGADDYVVKPFDSEELVARIQALLRRGGATTQPILTWGNLSLDPNSRKVSYGVHLLTMTPKEYAILELFLRNPQKVFSAPAILNHVWNSVEAPSEEAVRVHIKEIRHKLKAAGAPKDFIKTFYQTGYRLNPLYSSTLAVQTNQQPTLPHVAELTAVNEELRVALEDLQITQTELLQKNHELEIAYQTIEQERQQLQAYRSELEIRVAERTAELVQTNAHLQQQRNQWQALFDHALDGIVIVDNEGHFVDANPAACTLFGLSKEALLKAHVSDFAPPDWDSPQVWQQFLQQGQILKELDLRHLDATTQPIEFNAIANFIPGYHLAILQNTREHQQVAANIQQAETQLREREAFLSSIYHGADQAVFVVAVTEGMEFHYVDFNRLAEQYSGLSNQDIHGKTPEEAFGSVTGTAFRQHYEQCLQAGKSISYEEHIIYKDHTIWTLTTLSPLKNAQEVIYHIVGTCIDITERKQLELDLQTSEAKLSQILDNTMAAISSFRVYANRDWEYEYWSAGCEKLFGYTLDNYNDKHFWLSKVHPDDLEQTIMSLFDAFFAEQDTTVEYRFWRQDGSLRWFSSSYTSRKIADDCWIVISVNQDITDRKQAELGLKELSGALSNALEGISRLDTEGHYIYVNDAYARIVGFTPEEMIGMSWQHTVHQNDIEYVTSMMQEMLRQGKVELEARGVRKDGSVLYKRLFLVAIYNDQQQFTGHFCFMKDISSRKQAEVTLERQLARVRLVSEISQFIRQTLDLEQILQRTVDQVRHILQTDRVVIFRFHPDLQGTVIAESVQAGWASILSTTIFDPCFRARYIEPYRLGRLSAIANLESAGLDPCYIDLLQNFQVKANLVVPILQSDLAQEEHLWGLLIAHHCASPRPWQDEEIELLKQLASQLGIAIQQSELYQQTRQELLERRRMQEALQESEERFRSLSASAPIGIRYTNADGICLYANQRWQEMSGLSLEESLGEGWLKAVHPDDREATKCAWETYLQQGKDQMGEIRLLTSQGDVRWIFCQNAPIHSNLSKILGHVSTQEDITNRKQAEQQIGEQAALLDIASDAIFVCNLDHRVLYWNRGAERLYGWQAEEMFGRLVHELLKSDAVQVAVGMQTLLEKGEWRGEICKVTKTGKEVIVEVSWTLVRDEAGQPKLVLSVETDITEKKQLAMQFYRAQRLESVGTLASGIAHDLNNVFTPILALSHLLRLKLPNLDAHSQELLELLSSSAERGADLVKQILMFARGAEGKRISMQVCHLLNEISNVIQQTFPKSIDIHRDIPTQSLWLVCADPTYLHQVFMNLCINARDAMLTGGTLTISARNQTLDLTDTRMHPDAKVGNYVVVTITDTGTGIQPELIDRIFDPFFTTKEPGTGTGLGLSTVLGIVKNHGGFLQVTSQVGEGSQFQVYLPASVGSTLEPEEKEIVLQGDGRLILIVDDEANVQQTNKALLENYRFTTVIAGDGAEALDLYQKHQQEIYAVLMDIMMPKMGGLTAIRRLRRINPQIRIIAISGLPSNRQKVLLAGANVFLPKPYTTQELLMAFHELIDE